MDNWGNPAQDAREAEARALDVQRREHLLEETLRQREADAATEQHRQALHATALREQDQEDYFAADMEQVAMWLSVPNSYATIIRFLMHEAGYIRYNGVASHVTPKGLSLMARYGKGR